MTDADKTKIVRLEQIEEFKTKLEEKIAGKVDKTQTGYNNRVFEVAMNNDNKNVDMGWNWDNGDGAGCAFRSADFATAAEKGAFIFFARKATGSNPSLMGQTDGTLKWNNKNLETYNIACSCTTAAATAAKTVNTGTTFALSAGQRIAIIFSTTNTANNPTLNVNGTGAKEIYYLGSKITSGVSKYFLEGAQEFIYDGTRWHLMGTNDTVNTAGAKQDTSKLFLVGTKAQGDYGQSYSRSTCYIGTDGYLYSNSAKVDVAAFNAKYSKPSTGIPKTDLASAVQTSLGLADGAVQKNSHPTLTGFEILQSGFVPSCDFHIYDDDDGGYLEMDGDQLFINNNLYIYGNIIYYGTHTSGSDVRLKDIKGNVELTAEQIASLPAIKFQWNDNEENDKKNKKAVQIGTIAQDVQKVIPEAVTEDKKGYLAVGYDKAAMVSVINLAKTVVEQQKTIEALTKRLEELEKKVK